MKWKVGDWCFYEFNLHQIKEVSNGYIKEVTDGSFCTSGSNLNECAFAMELRIKSISDSVEYWSQKLHTELKNGANFPDIHRFLVQKWVEACHATTKEQTTKVLREVADFSTTMIRKFEDFKYEQVSGVRLMR
jgi:hypothetical protein